MRGVLRPSIASVCLLASGVALGQPGPSRPTPPPAAPVTPADPVTHGEAMRAYHVALNQRRLGWQELKLDELRARLAEGELLLRDGRTDEAASRMLEVVEHPRFDLFVDTDDGRAALFLLGDALGRAGAYELARAYLRGLLGSRTAWSGNATYARRSVRRLVEIASETNDFAAGQADLRAVPASAPEETRGEVAYITGRAREALGDAEGALAAYATVTQASRFWAQATYLQGLILVEKGRYHEGENLFCKIADPHRQANTTPVFADERYFAVRDLARLALGRVAHEERRFDDARYYYYLVPEDSDRLAEALYEAATSRYEKKDYEGASELLAELARIHNHHRYEDEAWVLGAYVDLARCKFDDADRKLREFLSRYEPIRDAARRVAGDERAMTAVLTAARSGTDAAATDESYAGGADTLRAIAALVRVDPAYEGVRRRRAILDHEGSGLRLALLSLGDMQSSLATNGGVRPGVLEHRDLGETRDTVKEALGGVRLQIDQLEQAHAATDKLAPLREELAHLEERATEPAPETAGGTAGGAPVGVDLKDLLGGDSARASALLRTVDVAGRELGKTEAQLAKDALRRLDLRLSRLLRRARLGRIESVLGRKRALEVEIEAINDGILPASALDSLDAARYLEDSEEYWPFEGDDWADEFVGSEAPK